MIPVMILYSELNWSADTRKFFQMKIISLIERNTSLKSATDVFVLEHVSCLFPTYILLSRFKSYLCCKYLAAVVCPCRSYIFFCVLFRKFLAAAGDFSCLCIRYPCFENPYQMDLHESPVTSCLYFADCPHDLIPAFYSVGCRQKKGGYSEKVGYQTKSIWNRHKFTHHPTCWPR